MLVQVDFAGQRLVTLANIDYTTTADMPSGKARLQLGESWVVEEGDESPEEQVRNEPDQDPLEPRSRTKAARQRPRKATRSPDPEFVMPSLDSSTIDGSWADTTSKSSRIQRSSRSADRPQETRRRSSRQAANSSSPGINYELRSSGKLPRPDKTIGPDALEAIMNHVGVMLSWTLDVLGRALRILKTPISYLVAVWLLFGLGVIARNLITTSIYASLSPICRIPGTSLLSLPFCPGNGVGPNGEPVPPVEFDQLMMVQSKFEEVLEESAGGVSLPMDMKRGEASIRDLRQLVKYSQLHSK